MSAIQTVVDNLLGDRWEQAIVRAAKTFLVVFLIGLFTAEKLPETWITVWPFIQQAGLAALGMGSWKAVNGPTVKV